VTGVNERGRSFVRSDEWLPLDSEPAGSFRRIALWEASGMPVSNADAGDPVPGGVVDYVVPEVPGTLIRIVDVPPDRSFGEVSELVRLPGVTLDDARLSVHRGFHKTDTLDLVLILEGEVWMLLDDQATLLRAGDVIVQRGTYHAWSNRSEQVCRVLVVMATAQSLTDH
jgi:mannose-6-phosphate isomerase-like protein (cupin superfamily)